MAKQKRRHHSPQEKVSILREHLLEGVSVSDVCDRHRINPTLFYRWQKQFFDDGSTVFDSSRSRKSTQDERRLAQAEAKLQKKDHVIAEIMAELIAEKKRDGEY
jgi:transposase-like protein